LRRALEELGPTFIKLGQILSDRGDIIPPSVVLEMKKLQDRVPPFPAEEAKRIVSENLNSPISDLFLYFYDEPEGAASLAQVHRAILPTGKPVAVKIKRPGIDDQIEADLQIMRQFAGFIDSYTGYFSTLSAQEIIDEFETQIRKELDFVEEFLSLKKFAADYENDDTVLVPEVYDEYTTHDLLVLEFVHGVKVSEIVENPGTRFDAKKSTCVRQISSCPSCSSMDISTQIHTRGIFLSLKEILSASSTSAWFTPSDRTNRTTSTS
jgi:ubiquinone biosynthesis protein